MNKKDKYCTFNNNINKLNINIADIVKITRKNQAIKIQTAYRDYKKRFKPNNTNQTLSHYTNENYLTETGTKKIEYLGKSNSNNIKQGFCIQKKKDGTKFKGIFIDDRVTGWGIYEHKNGDIYRGEYANDRIYGYGEYSHKNGGVYYGYWIDDIQFGIGYEIWEDSSQYSGEYFNGKKDGIGIYLWEDGKKYMGEWKENIIEGFGIYKYIDERQYSGELKNNQMHGYGEFIWNDGKKFVGFYKNDKKDGFGIYYFPYDKFFVRFWKEEKQNRVGKFIKNDIVKYGVWKDDKRIKWFENEDEFVNFLEPKDEKYIFEFAMNQYKLRKYLDLNEDIDENENNSRNKGKESIEEFGKNRDEQSNEDQEDEY